MFSSLPSTSQTARAIRERPAPSTQHQDAALELRTRGWTEAMVQRFLGEPDHRIVNPYYRTAAPMRLYRAARVLAAEQSPDFADRAAKAAARSARGKAIAEHKAQALLEQIAGMPVSVRCMAPEALQQCAIRSYNERQRRRAWDSEHPAAWDFEPATETSDAGFLERISVNYARHQLTAYDRRLEEVAGQIGVLRAITAIRQRIYAAIAEAYPHLAQECARQLARRLGQA